MSIERRGLGRVHEQRQGLNGELLTRQVLDVGERVERSRQAFRQDDTQRHHGRGAFLPSPGDRSSRSRDVVHAFDSVQDVQIL